MSLSSIYREPTNPFYSRPDPKHNNVQALQAGSPCSGGSEACPTYVQTRRGGEGDRQGRGAQQ